MKFGVVWFKFVEIGAVWCKFGAEWCSLLRVGIV